MEQDKLSKLLNDLTLSKFAKRKLIEVNALSGGQYSVNRSKSFKILMLRSDLCDYNDKYIVVTWIITFEGTNNANKRNKNLTFKNSASFSSRISKFKNTFIANAEDLDVVMPMHNLLECSDNDSMTSRSLWNYYRDEVIDDANEINEAGDYRINKNNLITSETF